MPPTRFEGHYTYQQTHYKWAVVCDEYVFDFRFWETPPTPEEIADYSLKKSGMEWCWVPKDPSPDPKIGCWVKVFADSEPMILSLLLGVVNKH